MHPSALYRTSPAAILPWVGIFAALLLAPQITAASIGTALLWFNLFLGLLLALMGRRTTILTFGLSPLLLGTGLSLLRLLLPLDLGWAWVVESRLLLPALRQLLGMEVFTLGGTSVSLLALLLPLWAIGSLVLLGCFLLTRLRFTRFARRLPPLKDPHIHALCRRVTGRDLPLCRSHGGSPFIFVLTRPTLVLPDYPYTDAQLDRILRHEWQHHLGRDSWIALLLDLLCALLWWDPLLWLLRRRSRRVLELRCDFGVLRTLDNEGRTDYYDIILQTARMAHAHKGHTHAFRLAAPPIVERFELGLDFARIERQSARYARLLHLAILLCWLLSYMVVFRAGTPLWI